MYNGERAVSSINGAWKTRQPHAKEWNCTNCITLYKKINSKWIKGSNVRPETIKLPEENIGGKQLNIGLGDVFCIWHQNQRQQKQK